MLVPVSRVPRIGSVAVEGMCESRHRNLCDVSVGPNWLAMKVLDLLSSCTFLFLFLLFFNFRFLINYLLFSVPRREVIYCRRPVVRGHGEFQGLRCSPYRPRIWGVRVICFYCVVLLYLLCGYAISVCICFVFICFMYLFCLYLFYVFTHVFVLLVCKILSFFLSFEFPNTHKKFKLITCYNVLI